MRRLEIFKLKPLLNTYKKDDFPYPFIYFNSRNPYSGTYTRSLKKVPLLGGASPYRHHGKYLHWQYLGQFTCACNWSFKVATSLFLACSWFWYIASFCAAAFSFSSFSCTIACNCDTCSRSWWIMLALENAESSPPALIIVKIESTTFLMVVKWFQTAFWLFKVITSGFAIA